MEEDVGQFCGVHGVLLSGIFKRKLVSKESSCDSVTNYFTFDEKMVANASILAANVTDDGGFFVDAFIADKKHA